MALGSRVSCQSLNYFRNETDILENKQGKRQLNLASVRPNQTKTDRSFVAPHRARLLH